MEIYTDRGVIKHGKYWGKGTQCFPYPFLCSLAWIYFAAHGSLQGAEP